LTKDLLSTDSATFAHASEDASCVIQVDRRVEFRNLALVHDANAVVVDDSLKTMGNAEQRFISEPILHGFLHEGIGLFKLAWVIRAESWTIPQSQPN
jgi:hypothetical protein